MSTFGAFTVTRASTKNVLGSAGTYISVANNVPAFEFNTDGTYRGLLVEPGATNLALHSQAFNEAVWAKNDATVTANVTTSPDGSASADKIVETATTAFHNVTQTFTPVSSTTYTVSVFLKASERTFAFVGFATGSMATTFISVNLSTGAVSTATGTPLASSTQDVGNGWYRVSMSLASTGTTASLVDIRASVDGVWANRVYTGDGTSGIFIWQAQLETGSVATSPIVTTGSTAARVADVISLTSASSLIGQSAGGTLFAEVEWRDALSTSQVILSASNNAIQNEIAIYETASTLRMYARVNDVVQTDQGQSTAGYSGIQKIAFRYAPNNAALYRNGSSISTDTVVDLSALATLTDVNIGSNYNEALQANMWIRAVALFSTPLTNAQLASLTTL